MSGSTERIRPVLIIVGGFLLYLGTGLAIAGVMAGAGLIGTIGCFLAALGVCLVYNGVKKICRGICGIGHAGNNQVLNSHIEFFYNNLPRSEGNSSFCDMFGEIAQCFSFTALTS